MNDGAEMLWISERDGWRHIYLHDNKGQIKRQITKGEWVVRDVKTDIWGNIHRPSNFDPSKSYPVVEMIYGSPALPQ